MMRLGSPGRRTVRAGRPTAIFSRIERDQTRGAGDGRAQEAKARLPALPDRVARGEQIAVTRRGKPIARMVSEGQVDLAAAPLKLWGHNEWIVPRREE